MIKSYNINLKVDRNTPTAISKTYFNNNDGAVLDFYYGPYSQPDNGVLFIDIPVNALQHTQRPLPTLDSEDLIQLVAISADKNITLSTGNKYYDSNGNATTVSGTKTLNGEYLYVYKNAIDFEKTLAEEYLTRSSQFFPGKKVAFIDELGKPIEYTVVETATPGEYEFCESSLVDVYTVNFEMLNSEDASTGGGMLSIQTCGSLYTAPRSEFKTPRYMVRMDKDDYYYRDKVFVGWTPDPDYNETDAHGTIFHVNELIRLNEYADTTTRQGEKFVTLYAVYQIPESVSVDFQNGYYDNAGNFQSIDTDSQAADLTGFIKITASQTADNKPDDWEVAYTSYFVDNPQYVYANNNTYFSTVSWQFVQTYLTGEDTPASETEKYLGNNDANYDWNGQNIKGSVIKHSDGASPVFGSYVYTGTDSDYLFVYEKSVAEQESQEPYLQPQKLTTRIWYKRLSKAANSQAIPMYIQNTNPTFIPNKTYYRQIVVDSLESFENGTYESTYYDCMDGTYISALSGKTVQFKTDLALSYTDRFEFDKWEVYGVDNTWDYVKTLQDFSGDTEAYNTWLSDHKVGEFNKTTSSVILNHPRVKDSPSPFDFFDDYSDKYIIRAVYKEKPIFAYIQLNANNYPATETTPAYELGSVNIGVLPMVSKYVFNSTPGYVTIGTMNTSGQIAVLNNVYGVSDDSDESHHSYLKINTLKTKTICLTAIPNNEVGKNPNDADYVTFCKWKGDVESTDTTIQLQLEAGYTYWVKAYFLRNDDKNAYVVVGRAMTYNDGTQSFGESKVEIHPVQYRQQARYVLNGAVGQDVEGVDAPFDDITYCRGYLLDTTEMAPIINIPTHYRSMNNMTNQNGGQDTPNGIGNYVMTMSNTVVGSPYKIDISKGTGYCYLAVKDENGLPFARWSDNFVGDDGQPPKERLVEVDVPGTFTYKAYFRTSIHGVNTTVGMVDDEEDVASVVDDVINNDDIGGGGIPGNGWFIIENSVPGIIGPSLPGWQPPTPVPTPNNPTYVFDNLDEMEEVDMPTMFEISYSVLNSTTGEMVDVTRAHYTYTPNAFAQNLNQSTQNSVGAANVDTNVDETNGTVTQTTTTTYYKGIVIR